MASSDPHNAAADEVAAEFETHRTRLLGLGYRMLGTVAEAEDLVQETYVRWHRARQTPDTIDSAGAWLSTTMARLCIDALRARKIRRETYVGPWLPEPWRTGTPENDDAPRQLEIADDLSVAFLLLLERLGPDERAAFLLHDVFDTDYAQIADSLDKSEVAVRQLVSRARQRVAEDRQRFRASRSAQRDLAARFQRALVTRDERALIALFKPDATLISDGGGKAIAALRPIIGADKVVRFFIGVTKGRDPDDFTFEPCWYNDAPTIVIRQIDVDGVFATLSIEVDDGRIATIYSMRNPDKLDRIARTPNETSDASQPAPVSKTPTDRS
jgi:RNA polymerase sigma-70 factor, ECF subfamily